MVTNVELEKIVKDHNVRFENYLETYNTYQTRGRTFT